MSHPYDASTKYLVEEHLPDWLPLSRRRATGPVEVLTVDLSTVTAAADKVLRILAAVPWLLHLELQSSRDPDLVRRLWLYNTLLDCRYDLPVWTVVVLLRPAADDPSLTGTLLRQFGDEPEPHGVFRYQVVRLWELPADTFLTGGLGLVPLAPLSAVAEEALPGVIRRMEERIRMEATPGEAGRLWTAAGVLMGLRYPKDLIARLLQGVRGMKESTFYQGIVEEGVLQGLKTALFRQGQKRFGAPTAQTVQAIDAITEVSRLEQLVDRVLDVGSWEELLAVP